MSDLGSLVLYLLMVDQACQVFVRLVAPWNNAYELVLWNVVMDLQVLLKIRRIRKGLPALRAREWLLSSVNSHVPLQI